MKDGKIIIAPMEKTVYPYIDEVRAYLEAGPEAVVKNFDYKQPKQSKPIVVFWTVEGFRPTCLYVDIAAKPDYSDATRLVPEAGASSVELKFLYKDTEYRVRVFDPETGISDEVTFRTTALGPRFLDVGGLYENCRDFGGYMSEYGMIKYDTLIRGSAPDNCNDAASMELTPEGMEYLTHRVGIRTQLDFRGEGENSFRTESSFPGARYFHVPIGEYGGAFAPEQVPLYSKVFHILADEKNYPLYMHCAGGSDRTGTVAFLLYTLLGVSKAEITQNYCVASFCKVGIATSPREPSRLDPIYEALEKFEGANTREKARSFLLSIGITEAEIENYKKILVE